jgi:hypothetical protein
MKNIYVVMFESIEKSEFIKKISDINILNSFFDVRQGIQFKIDNIVTYDASVFCFDTLLEDGYDVTLINNDRYIKLSELLDNDGSYISKHMKKSHNTFKMLQANRFNWKKIDNPKESGRAKGLGVNVL